MSGFPVEEYTVDVFAELGLKRHICPSCRMPYWSSDQFSTLCGEAPCVEYTFIKNPIGKRMSNVSEVRTSFLEFFRSKGHEILQPYPVVSRWRNDLYLTDASIVDFQPYVTNGMIPPPANPLVISQPCIRLVDMDNVGIIRRHFTIFEMGGHHAFNSTVKEVYWKDATVRYCIEYFTKTLGFPLEALSFKESVWSGGGNAGPCFEVISRGLEVATLVFMKFRTSATGEYIELPIRTVDTGYGIERMLWALTGGASPFPVLYGSIFDWLRDLIGISYDENVFAAYSIKNALFNPDRENIIEFKKMVFRNLGLSLSEYEVTMTSLENIMRALDHSKSLVFILSEGVVPSNTGVGYLARLLARKTIRVLRSLGQEDAFIELIERQLELWGSEFPNLKENEDEVRTLAWVEAGKYADTLEKGKRLVEKLLSSRGSNYFNNEVFVTLYDSHGLTPDDVVGFLQIKGSPLKAPEGFYSMVATRHAKELASKPQSTEPEELAPPSNLPPTERLYYNSPTEMTQRARVLHILRPNYVILDKTIFYPEGGGQPSDCGHIEFNGQSFKVEEVIAQGNVILHRLDREFSGDTGTVVECAVDEKRRWALRRAHTATHMVNWAARQTLGGHVWQHGAQKGEEESRLDITHYANLTPDEVRNIERKANELVMKDVPVRIELLDRTTAERMYGFRIYQGGVVPSKEIRIVSVGDYETEACGGLHLDSSGQAGMIKIIGVDKIQDGVVRIIFRVGPSAIDYVQEAETVLKRAQEFSKTDWRSLPTYLEEMIKKMDETNSYLESVKEKEVVNLSKILTESLSVVHGMRVAIHADETHDLMTLIKAGQRVAEQEPQAIIILFSITIDKTEYCVLTGKESVNLGFDSGKFVRTFSASLKGQGGGKPNFARGGVEKVYSAQKLIAMSKEILGQYVRRG